MNKYTPTLESAEIQNGVLYLDIFYPRTDPEPNEEKVSSIQIGLMDVRAADDIRISYDFARGGWRIEQEIIHTTNGHFRGSGEWRETAFAPAWKNEVSS